MATFIIDLAGAVALLIWAVRMVRTGVERAYAASLRDWLRRNRERRLLSLGIGIAGSVMMQSSTAVAVLVAGFVSSGTLEAGVGLAVILGADVGSALVAQILLIMPHMVVPILFIFGVSLFLRGRTKEMRQFGRILVGLGLIFVALSMIRATTAPLKDSAEVVRMLGYFGNDLMSAFVVGALFAWAAHSSVAAVLLVVTLALHGVIGVNAAIALILGANFGGAMIAFTLTMRAEAEARRVIVSNVVLRGGGAVIAVALISVMPLAAVSHAQAATTAMIAHLVFNVAVAAIGLPLTRSVLALCDSFIAPPAPVDGPGRLDVVSALNAGALSNPNQALACANREVLRIGDEVEAMLGAVLKPFKDWESGGGDMIVQSSKRVKKMHFDTKVYLAKLQAAELTDAQQARISDLNLISQRLEGAAEIMTRNLLGLARKLQSDKVHFSDAGWDDIQSFHDRVLANARLAMQVLIAPDVETARLLVEEKESLRGFETRLHQRHLKRLQGGNADTMNTSNAHQDMLHNLKQLNTAFATIAYPVLKESGLRTKGMASGDGPIAPAADDGDARV